MESRSRITGTICTVYDNEVSHQPSISIAKRIGDVFFTPAFDRGFSGQYRMLAIGLPHNSSHAERLHSCSMDVDVDLPPQSSVGRPRR